MGVPKHARIDSDLEVPKSQLPAHLLMILTQVLSALYYVITFSALSNGMNRIVLSLYRDILAMIVLIPAAYFIDRGNRIKLSWDVCLHLFVLGLFGIYGSNYLLFVGIEYTSAEVSAAMQPAIPVLTTLIAIVFGVEAVRWRRTDGQAKIFGILASCCGAIVMTAYKGQAVIGFWNNVGQSWTPLWNSLKKMSSVEVRTLSLTDWYISSWQFGVLCLFGNCVCMASFINIQKPLLNRFPAPASILVYSYGIGAILMGITGYFSVTDSSAWTLGWDGDLVAVLYNGIVASAINFGIMGWVLNRVGPLFVASYIPMQPIISAILSLVFIGTTIYLGSIIGTVLVISGLLLVSWSREEAARLAAQIVVAEDPLQDPLLRTV